MEVKKTKKTHEYYELDFKEEILRMRIAAQLNSGKNVDEINIKDFWDWQKCSLYLEKQIPNERPKPRPQRSKQRIV